MANRRNRRRRKSIINLADSGLGRVFIHYCCIGEVEYSPCISVDSVSVSRGEPTPIYCPSPVTNGGFDIVSTIPGGEGLYTSTLNTHMTLDTINIFHKLFELNCPFDISIHYGNCVNADDFYGYSKIVWFKNVTITDYSVDNLVVLQASDRGSITETISISFEKMLTLLPIEDLTETRIEDTTINSFSILRDNTCAACSACAICQCSNLGLATDGLQNVITSWQDNGDKLVFINDTGGIQVIKASDYIEDQMITCLFNTVITLDVGELITVGTFRYVGTDQGKVIYIDEKQQSIVLLDTGGVVITSINYKQYEEVIVGDADGNVYTSNEGEPLVQTDTTPTNAQVSAVTTCEGNYILGDLVGDLFYSVDGGCTWEEISYGCGASPILSIECCDCIQFFVGTEDFLLYSSDSLNDLQVIDDNYENYKHILCCGNDAIILSEDNADSIILST